MTTTEDPCRHCGKRLADGLDGWCPPCRAISACYGLCADLTDALESFLEARWSPHEYGKPRPAYYLDEPDFAGDPAVYMAEIIAAHAQITAAAQRLAQLAMGPGMWARVYGYTPQNCGGEGLSASFEFGYHPPPGWAVGIDPNIDTEYAALVEEMGD